MTLSDRVADWILTASLLGLAGCPVGMDHRDGRGGPQGSEPGRDDDARGDSGDSRRDDGHDEEHHPDDDHPR